MRSRMFFLLVIFLTLSIGLPMSAYADPTEVTVSVDIQPCFELKLVNSTGGPLTTMAWTPTWQDFDWEANAWIKIPGEDPYYYTGGWTKSSRTATCLIKANTAWHLYVRGQNALFSGGSGTKPVGDIVWVDGGEPYRHLTTSDVAVYDDAGPAGSYEDNDDLEIGIFFRILLDWASDSQGKYTNTVIFTLSD